MMIAGAGGFAKELLEAILQSNITGELVFFDDQTDSQRRLFLDRYRIITSVDAAADYFHSTDRQFVLGVGSPTGRKILNQKLSAVGGELSSVKSPFARVGSTKNQLSAGISILANAVIESCNVIGKGSLIHVGAFVSHDCLIGEYCEISPQACLLGGVEIEDMCRLGTACTIMPGIKIGNNSVVGAGSVVTRDVPSNQVVMGVPARKAGS